MQRKLWEDEGNLDLQDASITLFREYFPSLKADEYFAGLQDVPWHQEEIIVFGKKYPEPRETAWYGDQGTTYTYSGITHTPKPWTPVLSEIREKVENETQERFNSVLLNRYRNGQDSVAWHADDEPELGENPVIASVSLGQTRRFQLRHKFLSKKTTSLELHHGDLLVMSGQTQHFWEHQVPKTKQDISARLNLTFRNIYCD